MELTDIIQLLDRIKGCTFAAIDVETKSNGIRRVTEGEVVILFNSKDSGYEKMVKRRLAESGKNPDDFTVSDLPWGERAVPGSPLIYHGEQAFLQTVTIREGKSRYYIGPIEVDGSAFMSTHNPQPGLTDDSKVVVRTYNLRSIKRMRIMGETIE